MHRGSFAKSVALKHRGNVIEAEADNVGIRALDVADHRRRGAWMA